MVDDSTVPGLAALDDEGAPAFHAPWQARAFAIAVALSEDGTYDWGAFQERLAAEVDRTDGPARPANETISEAVYYRQWLAALERLLVDDGVLDPGELTDRTHEFAVGDRDASEWVEGDHGHDREDHEHAGHGHEHGHEGHEHGRDEHEHDHGEGEHRH